MDKTDQLSNSNLFEVDKEKLEALYKEAQELSSEAEISLSEYFAYILSLRNRKSHTSDTQTITP